MYKPSLLFDRTPKERSDPFASWAREDQAFFAAGACHILAELFIQLHADEGYQMIHIKPGGTYPGNHVYATDGTWAFDHNGWTREDELLAITKTAYEERYPGWNFERRIVTEGLEAFCKQNNHRLPWQYAYLPWERAYDYLQHFGTKPLG